MNFLDVREDKQPQLYLWGPPNTGKTYWLKRLLDFSFAFEPPSNAPKFAFADLDFNLHKFIYFNEFQPKTWLSSAMPMLQLLANETFRFNVKHETSRSTGDHKYPVIMVTNHPPPYDNEPFMERIFVVEALQVRGSFTFFLFFLEVCFLRKTEMRSRDYSGDVFAILEKLR